MNDLWLLAEVDIREQFEPNFQYGMAPETIGQFITWVLPQVYTVSLMLVFIYLIWGGYRYLISGGDPKAINAAKGHLTWAIAGLIIIFVGYWLFQALDFLLLETFD